LHNISECAKKLVALLNAVERLDIKKTELPFLLDDTKALARELKNERQFLDTIK